MSKNQRVYSDKNEEKIKDLGDQELVDFKTTEIVHKEHSDAFSLLLKIHESIEENGTSPDAIRRALKAAAVFYLGDGDTF